MKLKRLLFVAVALMAIALAHATSWRINPDPKAKAQFKTVAEAIEDVHVRAGDTLLLDPGYHGEITFSKENITVIGSGYLLNQNKGWTENEQTYISTAWMSPGSCIEGCSANQIYAATNSTVRRCSVGEIPYYRWFEDGGNHNFIVEQCYVTKGIIAKDHCTIRNNIILGNIHCYNNVGIVIENNTLIMDQPYGTVIPLYICGDALNCSIRNNIFINTNQELNDDLIPASSGHLYEKEATGWSMHNNITSIAPEYKDKKYSNYDIGATVESVFLNEGSDDGKWQLSKNSPAKGAAADGGDCGAFGGKNPYVLSGLPKFVPHITNIEVPSRPTNGKLTIKLKIENQDE